MQYQSSRKFARILHLAIAVFQFVYIYTPLHRWHYGLSVVQWITFPLLVISGLWLWKGHKIWLWATRQPEALLDVEEQHA